MEHKWGEECNSSDFDPDPGYFDWHFWRTCLNCGAIEYTCTKPWLFNIHEDPPVGCPGDKNETK